MKKLSLLTLAAAGMLLGACSSDNDVAVNGSKEINTGNEGYIGIAIQLPDASTPTLPTRSNDQYDDGDAKEYAVKSGKLFLFKGGDEASSTFVLSSDIITPTEGWNTDGSNYVTTTKTAVAKITKIAINSSENLYAYVALNCTGTTFAANPAAGTTFKEWSETAEAAAKIGGSLEGEISENGLLMTNAPIAGKQGGSVSPTGAQITTAVILDKDAIKETKEAAEAAPAGCVFVERAAAKVTLEVGAGLSATSIDMKDASDNNLSMSTSDIVWQIINTEPKFYNTRQANFSEWLPYNNGSATNSNSKYRFVSNNLFSPQVPSAAGHSDGYRTYFAKDPTYATDHTTGLNKHVATDDANHWLSTYAEEKGKRAYVPENTFPTSLQTRQNTTQATVRVKFNGGDDFYTITNEALYFNETNAKAKLNDKILADYNVNKYMTDAANNIATAKGESVTGSLTIALTTSNAGDVTYTVTPKFTGTADYTADDITDTALKTHLSSAISAAINDNVLTLYKGGYAYYNVRIKHFGEVETPWNASGTYVTKPGSTTEQIYKISNPTYGDNAFLGRYGIVRDNWYKLSIDGITKLGTATPQTVSGDPTPDDEIEKEYYISAHVHIVPWVLRTQSVSF